MKNKASIRLKANITLLVIVLLTAVAASCFGQNFTKAQEDSITLAFEHRPVAPAVRIFQTKSTISPVVNEYGSEYGLCNTKNEASYTSYFKYAGTDSVCVVQEIYFNDVKTEWAKKFLTEKMGFVKSTSGYFKETANGKISAEVFFIEKNLKEGVIWNTTIVEIRKL